ncbi:hypothetical protein RvY_00473 [Ramazzottius varieornatus]|uniref:Receptor ligand binding region domain-containing protein n=1 Tax=Ramazzottius varieornatus TaxID=947166 RepID=A0A1D1UNB1_RAMVA|nr:hypothetical protein RvY_00473 [Ramazzottius varieornatus]
MVGTYKSFGQAALKLTQNFDWHHVSLLLDHSVVSTDFYRLLANEILAASLSSSSWPYSVAILNFDGSDEATISGSLQSAQARSRVIFILSDTKTALRVLVS